MSIELLYRLEHHRAAAAVATIRIVGTSGDGWDHGFSVSWYVVPGMGLLFIASLCIKVEMKKAALFSSGGLLR